LPIIALVDIILILATTQKSPPILHPMSVKVRWPSSPAGERPEP
jgi:hypothetical protein